MFAAHVDVIVNDDYVNDNVWYLPTATPAELYNAVLVDTPLANFFSDCISEADLDELNVEIIRNKLYKVRYPCSCLYPCV